MSERLFIRLGKTSTSPCSWLVWSEQEQEIIASGELSDAASLTSLTERAGNRPVDVLVPAASMTLTQIALPEKNQRQALKALPFMLEETIASDVETMHFVVGPRDGEQLNVAAVAHEQMQNWLSWLLDAGIKVKSIVPDCLALPLDQCCWAALDMGDELLLRTGEGSGVSLPKTWLDFALPELLSRRSDADSALKIAAYSEDLVFTNAEVEAKPLDIPMMVLAKGILQAPINLLSGVYQPKREYSKHLMLWKNAAIVAVIAIVLGLVNKGLTIHQLNQQTAEIKQQSEAIFKRVSPGVNRIVNIRSQLDSQLRSLKGQGGGAAFFDMLDGLKESFQKVPDLKPNSIRFDASRNELRMQVTAKSYDHVDKFKQLVEARYEFDMGAINSGDNEVNTTITLKGK
ncbi:type II secretion system protein GspL [Shewanella sp. 5_MG-2023]|uniref:type II secretion system protein GspL n=1 Tax=Shewanella sp. 5_MG-2023 TaxID=3062656 RepID=UPI0026E2266B|nr:type II secretion system protein GspL [Shewanella sp. 5_MG-2023]MDO6640569.1 type II secretion system protein GspL [Shewanella sp. 5_MG-2023]